MFAYLFACVLVFLTHLHAGLIDCTPTRWLVFEKYLLTYSLTRSCTDLLTCMCACLLAGCLLARSLPGWVAGLLACELLLASYLLFGVLTCTDLGITYRLAN